MSEAARASLHGNLRLVCRAAPERGTYLAEQAFSAPMHVSKAYWDGATLLVNVVNPTAGIFGGDRVSAHVTVEAGARVLLSSPSAARFHPSHGRTARLEQTFIVSAGGSLEVFPEISIPQRDSISFQKTTIQIEPGGELVYLETLTPGRVASGEAFAFARYAWATDIRVGGRLVLRERADVQPGATGVASLRALFPASYYASVVVIVPEAKTWREDFAHAVAKLESGTLKLVPRNCVRTVGPSGCWRRKAWLCAKGFTASGRYFTNGWAARCRRRGGQVRGRPALRVRAQDGQIFQGVIGRDRPETAAPILKQGRLSQSKSARPDKRVVGLTVPAPHSHGKSPRFVLECFTDEVHF